MSKIETNQVDPATGTTLTLGTSGDTITIPSGVTIANSGTATGFGGDNTPAFIAHLNADQSITNSTYTTITFTETYDSDNAFSSNTFTVPSGEAGKYFISLAIRVQSVGNDIVISKVIKNGSTTVLFGRNEFNTTSYGLYSHNFIMLSGILDLSAGDTLIGQVYGKTYNSSATTIQGDSGGSETWFHGYKLIGI
jgi:hypothetical protein